MTVDKETQIKAAVFDRLVQHFQYNTDIQNIDLMITGKFCRNCFYKWYKTAAQELGEDVSVEEAQEKIYGMPYSDYKEKYQKPTTPEQLAAFEKVHKK
ncbi:MAG: DUF1244 domain-containing protein [Gammaproteobacteria bacterium]|nr:DUF1244 domain-containing protein [Gammaproteobacteria bacterium]